jgi:hypothetical protein
MRSLVIAPEKCVSALRGVIYSYVKYVLLVVRCLSGWILGWALSLFRAVLYELPAAMLLFLEVQFSRLCGFTGFCSVRLKSGDSKIRTGLTVYMLGAC